MMIVENASSCLRHSTPVLDPTFNRFAACGSNNTHFLAGTLSLAQLFSVREIGPTAYKVDTYHITIFAACAGNGLVSPCTATLNPVFIGSVMLDSGLDHFDVWVATPSTMDLVPLVRVPVATNALTALPGMLLTGKYRGISAYQVLVGIQRLLEC